MKVGSKISSGLLLAAAYGFAGFAVFAVYQRGAQIQGGYLYLLALVAVLLLLAGHGVELVRRSQARRLNANASRINDVATSVTLAIWEIFFGWLGLLSALVFLYYAAPPLTLADWYPRLFLCVTVLFAAMSQRALTFFHTTLPFVLTATILALYEQSSSEALAEAVAKVGFLAIDLGLLLWALRLARAEGVFSVSQFELPVGPGRIGGRLTGVIRNQTRTTPIGGYLLELTCLRQTREKGKAASGEVLCHLRQVVRGDLPGARFNHSSVPVDFALPESALASAAADQARVAWTLRAEAQLPDTDFKCVFEAPVEQDVAPDSQPRQAALTDPVGAKPPTPAPLGKPNGKAVLFRPPETWNAATELLVSSYFAFWAQLVWLSTAEALGWEGMAMFVVGLCFLVALVAPWFQRLECELSPDGVVTRRRTPFGTKRATVELPVIESIEVEPSSVRAGLVDAIQHYSLFLRTREGRRIEAAGTFRERRIAEAAAAEVLNLVRKLQDARPRSAEKARPDSDSAAVADTQLQQA